MRTALELLEELKDKLDPMEYDHQRKVLENEQFQFDFEKAFAYSFKCDRSELKEAVSHYTDGKKDKTYFIRNIYPRDGLREFLHDYWNRMDQIIVLVIEKLAELDKEESEE